MPFQSRMWGVSKVLLLGAALLATYLLFAVAAARVALKAREVTVPSLSGQTVSAASALVASLDLTLRVDESRRIDPKIPAETIVAQDLSPGTTTRRGRSIRVWLSAGATATAVPALVGESERMARLRLEQDGFEVGTVSEIRSNEQPPGVVVAQEPPAGSRGSRVALLVNRGDRAASYVMPDLIGVDAARASEILRASGFRVAVVGQHPYPGVAPGIVLRQAPQGGFQISPGEPISLEVSR